MIENFYKYKEKIIKADKEQPLLLPILGIITRVFKNTFDLWDVRFVVDVIIL